MITYKDYKQVFINADFKLTKMNNAKLTLHQRHTLPLMKFGEDVYLVERKKKGGV